MTAMSGAVQAGSCDFQEIFAPPVNLTSGGIPRTVVLGDLDGDGDLDIAVANSASNTVGVLLNTGAGGFLPQVTYAVNDPRDLASGDLDGDGDLDIVVANTNGTAGVLLNNGAGVFSPEVAFGSGDFSFGVAIGDLDGDGDADLAVTNNQSNNVSVLLNNGNATFAPDMLYGVGAQPSRVAIADLDADGDADLVVTNSGSDNISVLRNNGDGSFAQDVLYGVGDFPTGLSVGDLDGDGDIDVVVANSASPQSFTKVSVLLNFGNGNFANAASYGQFDSAQSVAIADYDGDGDPDLAVGFFGTALIQVLPNAGDGTFGGTPAAYPAFSRPLSVVAGDLDGDGDPDLVSANTDPDRITVFINEYECVVPPTITEQPDALVLLPIGGSIANLSVSAIGNAPLIYQWRKDGNDLIDNASVSGSTTPNLTIAATLQSVGQYDVVITNPDGSIVSDPTVLGVRASASADLDGDGDVDTVDLGILLGAFGTMYP